MGTTVDTQPPKQVIQMPPVLAVSYLRVSIREQAERGGTEEGFSIPAQREAIQRKAIELGARVAREFMDAGESARSADRDGLQDLLAFIAATRVQFCIVHKLDQFARNRADDVRGFTKPSLQLVSRSCLPQSRSTKPRRGCCIAAPAVHGCCSTSRLTRAARPTPTSSAPAAPPRRPPAPDARCPYRLRNDWSRTPSLDHNQRG